MNKATDTTTMMPPITLGTVQLGQAYGIANRRGMIDDESAMAILDVAWDGGIRKFDTARLYGESEARLGRWIAARRVNPSIVTKCPPLGPDQDAAAIREQLELSLRALGLNSIDGLLLHRASDLGRPNVASVMRQLQHEGLIGGFGVSVYDTDCVDQLLRIEGLNLLQAPLNVLDRRLVISGALTECRDSGIAVFARSVFLQGLVLMASTDIPPALADAVEPICRLNDLAGRCGRPVAEIAVVFVRDTPGVSSIVIGAEQIEQVRSFLRYASSPPLAEAVLDELVSIGTGVSEHVINPGHWELLP